MRFIDKKTAGAAITIIILGITFLSSCDYQCEEKILREATSPTGKYVAVIFEQNCGATTSILYHVNIRPSNSGFKKDDQGHILDGRVFTGYGDIKIKWGNDHYLLVEYKGIEGVDHSKSCESPWKDVTIECKAHK